MSVNNTQDLHYVELFAQDPEWVKRQMVQLELDFESRSCGQAAILMIIGQLDQVESAADILDLERDEISIW